MLLLVLRADAQGDCTPPLASFSTSAGDTARICTGDQLDVDGSTSSATPGRVIQTWVWHVGTQRDTATTATTTLAFPNGGAFRVTLEVIDDIGCSSGESAPIHVLVSGTPDFSGTVVPATACEGQVVELSAHAEQAPMVVYTASCTPDTEPMYLPDDVGFPFSMEIDVAGRSGVVEDVAELGDICMEIEHSHMGDLVLQVTCPNGQTVILHQQGGGGTYLGDANDGDSSTNPAPGVCYRYCFNATPDHGTLAASAASGATPNVVPLPTGVALIPGSYASVQPLSQLVGCPFSGTWTFTAIDLWAADNGFLCGWCIDFDATPDSSLIDHGPILGTSPDSSYWSGTGITNTAGMPGQAGFEAVPGEHDITYNVLDSYGCQHEATFSISVGEVPVVSITNTENGSLCAEPSDAAYTYQWSYNGELQEGAEEACFTPPGGGLVSVEVSNTHGCSGSGIFLGTGINHASEAGAALVIAPSPNDGRFSVSLPTTLTGTGTLRITDSTGRMVFARNVASATTRIELDLHGQLRPGLYALSIGTGQFAHVQRMVVE